MNKRHLNLLICALALIVTTNLSSLKASNNNETLDVNGAFVNAELYIWNRISDLLDIAQIGIAFGPGIGAEVAVTNYAQLSAYANVEHGMLFPNLLPPFWLTDYYENNPNSFETHAGKYATAAFGPWRRESGIDPAENAKKHFRRDKWDVRVQLDFLLIHIYLSFRPVEFIDFITGIGGYDFSDDDMVLDPLQTRRPADQLGRGIANIAFGALEIPLTIFRTTESEGDMPGLCKAPFVGIWRCLCREIVGVVETITFPFGWEPIILPAYVWDGDMHDNTWDVSRPSFHKRF